MFRKAYWFVFVLMFLVPMGFGTAGVSAQSPQQQLPVIGNSTPPFPVPQVGDHILIETNVNTPEEALTIDVAYWCNVDANNPTVIIDNAVYLRGTLTRAIELRQISPAYLATSLSLKRLMRDAPPGATLWVDARRQVGQDSRIISIDGETPQGARQEHYIWHQIDPRNFCLLWVIWI